MIRDKKNVLYDSIKRLLRRDATVHLKKIVNKTHAADLSVVFRSLPLFQQRRLFALIDDVEQKGLLFSELEDEDLMELIDVMPVVEIVTILESMPADDVADLIGKLPGEKADAILEKMHKEGSEEVEDLLRYGDDTAGGIMVPDFIALGEDLTASRRLGWDRGRVRDVVPLPNGRRLPRAAAEPGHGHGGSTRGHASEGAPPREESFLFVSHGYLE